MTIQSSPLLGYNNNVRHRGRVFHIQTEDSGAKYGHIMTHLFTDGGRILKSVKTSYAEYLGSERMAEIVREMMKQQHKAMYIALRDGKFDAITDGTTDSLSQASRPPAGSPPAAKGSVSIDATVPVRGADGRSPAPNVSVSPLGSASPVVGRETEDLALDVDVLERAASAAEAGDRDGVEPNQLPPPPANLLREKRASAVGPKPPVSAQTVRKASSAATKAVANERRYAPTRPASIFGQARPQQGKSIFGEDLMSDKSLDEVILSYLADDLDTEKK